jgi:Protein of unknown function (DUF3276)
VAYDSKKYSEYKNGNQNDFRGESKSESVFSKRVKAGKRRTYFFDVRTTRGSDYFITITESKKRFDDNGYDRHKMFLYKEDFNKFLQGLTETINHIKTDLMPDFDFDSYTNDSETDDAVAEATAVSAGVLQDLSEVDDWKM